MAHFAVSVLTQHLIKSNTEVDSNYSSTSTGPKMNRVDPWTDDALASPPFPHPNSLRTPQSSRGPRGNSKYPGLQTLSVLFYILE